MEITWELVLLATITIYLAEIFGVIVGGGGFLAQPVLLLLGLPPTFAVAQDIFACQGTNLGGFYVFWRTKNLRYDLVKWWLPGLICGSIAGVYFLTLVPVWLFEKILGFCAVLALLYLWQGPKNFGLVQKSLPRFQHCYAIILSIFWAFTLAFPEQGLDC